MSTEPKTAPLPAMARELGISRDEALEMKRQIERVDISGPQRWEYGARLDIPHPERDHVFRHCPVCGITLDIRDDRETCEYIRRQWPKWHAGCEVK